MADSSNVNPSSSKPYGTGRMLIGNIYFARNSSTLTTGDRKELDKLVDLLATWPKGMAAAKLLFLGHKESKESPPKLGLQRAEAVKKYVESELRDAKKADKAQIKAQDAGQGGLPGRESGRNLKNKQLVELVNTGPRLVAAPGTIARAASRKHLYELIQAVHMGWKHIHKGRDVRTERTRIQYWTTGEAAYDLWQKSGNDGYLNANSGKVKQQAAPRSKELNDGVFQSMINENRIVEKLMQVGGEGTDHAAVIQRLLDIDREILFGINFLVDAVGRGAAPAGLQQMVAHVTDNGDTPRHFYYAYRHPDKIPKYHVVEKRK